MSKTQGTKIDKIHLLKLQSSKKQTLQTPQPQINKQNLRDLIFDFVIQKLYKENQKANNPKTTKYISNQQSRKRIPIEVQVQTKEGGRKVQVNVYVVLDKYIELERKNLFKQTNIETLVMQILNFFDSIKQISNKINLELNEQKQLSSRNIQILLQHYIKDQQSIIRMKQLDYLKQKTSTDKKLNPKHNDCLNNQNFDSSHQISRNTINSSFPDKDSTQSKEIKTSKSKLKDLVDNCKVFQHPEKVEKLKKQKIKQLYQGSEIDRITQSSKKQPSILINGNNTNENYLYLQFLQQWITEITISEKLFQNKIQQKEAKLKQNLSKVTKIIKESNDDHKQIRNDLIFNL